MTEATRIDLARWIRDNTAGCESIVELGCGDMQWLTIVAPECQRRIGIDIMDVKPHPNAYRFTSIRGDMRIYRYLLAHHLPIDCALIVDSLEHLQKDDGVALVESLQEDFKRILLMVPHGHHPQPPTPENPYQEHKATWVVAELEALGFDVVLDPHYHFTYVEKEQGCMFAQWRRQE